MHISISLLHYRFRIETCVSTVNFLYSHAFVYSCNPTIFFSFTWCSFSSYRYKYVYREYNTLHIQYMKCTAKCFFMKRLFYTNVSITSHAKCIFTFTHIYNYEYSYLFSHTTTIDLYTQCNSHSKKNTYSNTSYE